MVPRFLKGIHWPIFIIAGLLTAIGIVAIYSASFRTGGDYAFKQLIWAAIALAVFLMTIQISYRPFLSMGYLLYGIAIILLVVVLVTGESRLGASRWINIGPFLLQPSELAKMAMILTLVNFLAGESSSSRQLRILLICTVIVGVPFLLILKQPDLGSALVFIPAFLAIVFFWGVRIRYFIIVFLLGCASIPFLWHSLKPYQQKRILVFLNPSVDPIGASYTAIQSKIAVGSGGLLGKGWLQGTQIQLDFVPEHHTDFIFCVVGEEFGYIGVFTVIFLFGLLIAYAFQIMNHTTDFRAKMLAMGIATVLFFQVFVNVGMTVGIAPITGITLPFISYGGSSLIATFFALGLLTSIYRERSIF